jgi:basic membrane lipoprotein Med (substrate-binding protein (PBP1-ABC) superfamily)
LRAGSQPAAAPHARQYVSVSACLLTDPQGIQPGTPAAPVWAAMRTASLSSHVMVSYLPDTGRADAADMLNSLIGRQCGVIIATGAAAGPVTAAAKANPDQSFLLVTAGRAARAAAPNTVVVSTADAPERIDQALHDLAAHASS